MNVSNSKTKSQRLKLCPQTNFKGRAVFAQRGTLGFHFECLYCATLSILVVLVTLANTGCSVAVTFGSGKTTLTQTDSVETTQVGSTNRAIVVPVELNP